MKARERVGEKLVQRRVEWLLLAEEEELNVCKHDDRQKAQQTCLVSNHVCGNLSFRTSPMKWHFTFQTFQQHLRIFWRTCCFYLVFNGYLKNIFSPSSSKRIVSTTTPFLLLHKVILILMKRSTYDLVPCQLREQKTAFFCQIASGSVQGREEYLFLRVIFWLTTGKYTLDSLHGFVVCSAFCIDVPQQKEK